MPATNVTADPSSSGTSRSLIARVRADEADAWERLVTLYAPLVYHWCRRANLPAEDASDVFQEVFQAVARGIGGFRKERPGDTFRGWLRTIARRKAIDHLRRQAREPMAQGGTEAGLRLGMVPAPCEQENGSGLNADDPAEAVAERLLMQRALELIRGEFAERTWQAFWRTAVDGLTPTEAAAELAMSAGAARVAKCRVLRRLREELGDAG
jgi:RNA polymerase sigma-70 factor (ECF subfamily)